MADPVPSAKGDDQRRQLWQAVVKGLAYGGAITAGFCLAAALLFGVLWIVVTIPW